MKLLSDEELKKYGYKISTSPMPFTEEDGTIHKGPFLNVGEVEKLLKAQASLPLRDIREKIEGVENPYRVHKSCFPENCTGSNIYRHVEDFRRAILEALGEMP